jgi:hypothetical protein
MRAPQMSIKVNDSISPILAEMFSCPIFEKVSRLVPRKQIPRKSPRYRHQNFLHNHLHEEEKLCYVERREADTAAALSV